MRLFKGGRERRKAIRRMSRLPLAEQRFRCNDRANRYRKMKKLEAPEIILSLYMQQWHDAEYALSIAEGYYDPKAEINKWVSRRCAKNGVEVTPEELMVWRVGIMSKLAPCLAKAGVPVEYGFAIRYMRPAFQQPTPEQTP